MRFVVIICSLMLGALPAAAMTNVTVTKSGPKAPSAAETPTAKGADARPEKKAVPLSPEQIEHRKFTGEQSLPQAVLQRSPLGLQILGFRHGGGGRMLVKFRNLTKSSVSVDGTKIRGVDYYTKRIFEGEATSGAYIDAGETREVLVGLIGTTSSPLAISWSGTNVWIDFDGKLYRSSDEAVAARTAVVQKARQDSRKAVLSPVNQGSVPVQR